MTLHLKIYFVRASMALHEYDEAALCFKKVLKLDENNTAVATDIAKLKAAVQKYKENRKSMSRKMVRKLFPKEEDGDCLRNTTNPVGKDSKEIAESESLPNVRGNEEREAVPRDELINVELSKPNLLNSDAENNSSKVLEQYHIGSVGISVGLSIIIAAVSIILFYFINGNFDEAIKG